MNPAQSTRLPSGGGPCQRAKNSLVLRFVQYSVGRAPPVTAASLLLPGHPSPGSPDADNPPAARLLRAHHPMSPAPHPLIRFRSGRGAGMVFTLLCLLLTLQSQAATRVLYLGDSFSKGAFGRTLDAQMRAAGLEVYTSVTGGASAYDWLPEFGATSTDIGYWEKTPKKEFRVGRISRIPKIDELVERWRPQVVVIQGGTNMYSVLTSKRRPREQNAAELERLLDRIGQIVTSSGARLYWVTPATAHPRRFSPELQAEMREILHRVGQRYGRTFDSYAVTRFTDPYPGTDGIHYGPTEAAAWSRLVAKDVIHYSSRLGSSSRRAFAVRGRAAAPETSADPPRARGLFDLFRRKRTAGATTPPRTAERTPASASTTPPAAQSSGTQLSASSPSDSNNDPPVSPPLEVEVVLRQKSAVANLGEVTYRSALGVFDYEVVAVHQGSYPAQTMRIAHLIVMNNQYTSINQRPIGSRMRLQVERLSKYPNLEKIQTVDDLPPAYDLDVFVPKL
jgi:hypothetical protein